jgi:hypothetical protein
MRSLREGPLDEIVTRIPYLLKFSIISRKIEQARTANARFLNPWRETVSIESRLRQDVRFFEWTANACLYFLAAACACFEPEMLCARCRKAGRPSWSVSGAFA